MSSLQKTMSSLQKHDQGCTAPRCRLARLLIAVAAEPRYLSQQQPAGLTGALVRCGHPATIIDPEDARALTLSGLDLLIARGRSPALLELLDRAAALGIAIVNPRASIESVMDKARMGRALAAAGIPIPPTRLDTMAELVASSTEADFPMVVKPVYGDNARGVCIVHSLEELAALPWKEPVALAQPYIASDGFDLKLYVAGAEVHAVRKPSPLSFKSGSQAVPMTAGLRELAFRCGEIFGLELFGVDCIETPDGPLVIEVNDFPNYSAVEDADDMLARFAIARARAAREERKR
jgi:ribosomal protein S6--L-glutamate ligase